jgi:hypothetical protein
MAGDGGRVPDVTDEELIPLHDVLEALGRYGADPELVAGVVRLKRAARSPQGEDHELGDDWRAVALQLADALRGLHPQNPYYREKQAEALAAFDALAGESNQNDERRR